jgi:tetratricopeptide (TPR) repeat protein
MHAYQHTHIFTSSSASTSLPLRADIKTTAAVPAVATATATATATASASAATKASDKSQSRFQFPVEMLVDERIRKETLSTTKEKQVASDVASEWEQLVNGVESDMQKELERNPNNVSCILDYSSFLASVLEDEDWVERTDSMFKSAVQADPKHIETLFRYANFAYEFKSAYQEAEDLYHRVLQHEPRHVLALANLATIQHSINENFDEAEQLYTLALDFHPERPTYFTMAHHVQRNATGGLPHPHDYAGIMYNFGALFHEVRRNLTVAKSLYTLALEYNNNSTAVLNNMGSLLAVQKEYDDAERMYRRAALLGPFDVVTWHNFGVLYAEKGRLEKAADCFVKALKQDPFYVPTCLTYGRCALCFVCADRCHVDCFFQSAARAKILIFLFLSYFRLLLESKCDIEGADRMYKRVFRRNPGQVHALIGSAQVYQVRGDMDMAEEMYSRAVDFHERNVAALIHKVR